MQNKNKNQKFEKLLKIRRQLYLRCTEFGGQSRNGTNSRRTNSQNITTINCFVKYNFAKGLILTPSSGGKTR